MLSKLLPQLVLEHSHSMYMVDQHVNPVIECGQRAVSYMMSFFYMEAITSQPLCNVSVSAQICIDVVRGPS